MKLSEIQSFVIISTIFGLEKKKITIRMKRPAKRADVCNVCLSGRLFVENMYELYIRLK